ncbi:MAG: extracellular solute-binding protein [Oscillospiraceae bacterium]|nr:extracellular solute-binding protein [Oscillospiraceae bacterium]
MRINRKYIKITAPPILVFVFVFILCGLFSCRQTNAGDIINKSEDNRIVVRLAAPQNNYIEDFDTNLYKLWLEEQTGLKIEMTWLPLENAEQIASQQLLGGEGLPDAYVGFANLEIFQPHNLQEYINRGNIISLTSLIETYGEHIKELFAGFPEYNIRENMTSADGHIYFMPGFGSSVIRKYRHMMWVNKNWLDELGLDPPETTEEFADMLRAFKNAYPDKIPMSGTEQAYSKQPYNFLFNAFIYNDENNSRLYPEDGKLVFSPVRNEWRNALLYMRGLYGEGLISPHTFTQDDRQFMQMANDPRDILGAFASPGITLVVQQNSPEILGRYIGIAPLTGPDGVRFTTVNSSAPRPAGVITSACRNPVEVFELFDLMLSEEASLIGRYGLRGTDWDFADEGDISIYGTPATIKLYNQLWNTLQNSHLAQITPYISHPKYSGGVTWDGSVTDGEYMNARSAMLHIGSEPPEYISRLLYLPGEEEQIQKIRAAAEVHTRESAVAFITGERDIYDDGEWEDYLAEFDAIGLEEFVRAAQAAYDRAGGGY